MASVQGATGRLFPEIAAGGFTRRDGSLEFYSRVNALLDPSFTVVDFGAGRGSELESTAAPYRTSLRTLQGKCARLIGLDVDDAVRLNSHLDEALVIDPTGPLPLADATADIIVADWVFEHLPDPDHSASELYRILKPGGWLCARTPNRFGYVGIAASMVPNALHTTVLARMQPDRKEKDVFPTVYRLNTFGALRRHFPEAQWNRLVYGWDAEPAYFGNSAALTRMAVMLHRLTPEFFATTLMVFFQKKG